MRSHTAAFSVAGAAVVAVLASVWLWPAHVYELRDGRRIASPSRWMDAKERLGLQRFYSQVGQDKWVLGLVHPGVDDGYFVDVGAYHATKSSNSKALEEAGWQGVCVEPVPRAWSNRSCQLFEEVAYSRTGEPVRFRVQGPLSGIEAHVKQSRKQAREARVVEFTTTTLGDILERADAPDYIHYISIDTEGSEYEILSVFPFDRYRVGAFSIEHGGEAQKRARLRELLEGQGYRWEREQLQEDWYVGPPPP